MTADRAIDERVVSVILTQIKSVFATSGASKFDTHTTPKIGALYEGFVPFTNTRIASSR